MGQLGIRIANVVLFSVCCFQVATVFNDVSADYLRPGPAAFDAAAAPALPAARGWNERQPILDRNLFGADISGGDLPLEPEPDVDLEETKLPVRLLGTQVHSIRENSQAALGDKAGREHEVLYEGDSLDQHPQARVVRIERGRVILDNQGRREELLLADASNAPAPRPSSNRNSRRRSRRAAAAKPAAESTADRLRDLQKNKSRRDMGAIFNQGRLTPKYEDGKLSGMELNDIEPGSLYEEIGLKNGDVIKAINGITLDNPGAASKVLPALASGEPVEIETENGPLNVDPAVLEEFMTGGDGPE